MKNLAESMNRYPIRETGAYAAPRIDTVEIYVEQGFATSVETSGTGLIYYIPDKEW